MSLNAALGCQIPERPKRIAISNVPAFRPAKAAYIQSFEQAVAAVITVAREDLNLPVVDSVDLHLYKNSLSFAVYGFGWTTLGPTRAS
jgi:hypothetical protein